MSITGTSTKVDSVGAPLPYVLPVQPGHDGFDSVEAAYLGRVFAGVHPHTATRRIGRLVDPAVLVPEGFVLERSHLAGTGREALCYAAPDGSLALEVSLMPGGVLVQVSGATRSAVAELVESFDAFDVDDDAEDEQRLVFWFNDGDGGARQSRAVQLPTWNDVKSNYPGPTRRCLDSLMSLERPAGSAKLIVWYGEPGTGKTTAAAALSKSWAPWARTHVVTDPDRLFNDPAYLTHVIMSSPPRRTAGVDPWPLVICEDSGDYLCKSSARHSDGALGRLLGTTDGLMGRGLSFLVLLTMNESLAAIDPAVKRSGRCLATVEFGRFNKDDAAKWLGGAGELPPGGVTLAELYERRAEQSRIATPEVSVETGFYL